ncbi:hypothetical protein LF1_06670 [Rubripirellula obstinata]|uniref:Phage head-tail joining protein domain-containing protein n=2 Tax=Rubripirellula TaxID=1579505 RepID=A0A5C5WJT3_9BACT|nr:MULTISPECIES: hypothetical protein [Rubripirellula]KAA1258152.1 hypothetical protein LF1_06670 [Rubripirellula obstinata]TWT51036.1 hypothetical protein Pla22_38120 [Rubripirellula amarantea]
MSDMLHKGQSWLAAKLTRFASRMVTYQRDEVSVDLPATIGKSEYEQDDGEGVITRAQVRDFLINTKDLLASPIGTWPRRGDRILETDGDTTFVYELMSIGSEPPWRYSDPFRVKLRIHTKLVDTIT